MSEEYKPLYEHGPAKIQVVTSNIRTGSYRGDSSNLQLEGILSGETENNLVFDSLRPLNLKEDYMDKFNSDKAYLRKDQVALLYAVSE